MKNANHPAPKVGEVITFAASPHTRLQVQKVETLRKKYHPAWSMWAVTAEIVESADQSRVGEVDTWHVNPQDLA